jgi:hypothetical protein
MNDYTEDDMTGEETKLVKKVWRQFCRDSTRAQILTTMSEHREIGNLIYDICNEELMSRDRAEERQHRSAESKAIWALVPPRQKTRMLKRRKLSSTVKSVNF